MEIWEALVPEACQPPDEAPPRGGRLEDGARHMALLLPKADAAPNLCLGKSDVISAERMTTERALSPLSVFLFRPSIYFIDANDPAFFY
jgi:hypothetical protein